MATPLLALKTTPRWGRKQRDPSFVDAEERERLAEARRKRFAGMMDKSKRRKGVERDPGGDPTGIDFDESTYGVLCLVCRCFRFRRRFKIKKKNFFLKSSSLLFLLFAVMVNTSKTDFDESTCLSSLLFSSS